MELKYDIKNCYPSVEIININVMDTNAWPWNRLREFSLKPGMESDFHLECPMTKCLGKTRGIFYRDAITKMVEDHAVHKQVKLNCVGYGGYNLTFHCDWYVILDISIKYR